MAAYQRESDPIEENRNKNPEGAGDGFIPIAAEATAGFVSSLLGAGLVAYLGLRRWRLQHFTKEWSNLLRFLQSNPQYMNRDKTERYTEAFQGDELVSYDLTARQCIGFVDDMFFLRYKRKLTSWFAGSIDLLVGTHRAWLRDNARSYDRKFIAFINKRLPRTP